MYITHIYSHVPWILQKCFSWCHQADGNLLAYFFYFSYFFISQNPNLSRLLLILQLQSFFAATKVVWTASVNIQCTCFQFCLYFFIFLCLRICVFKAMVVWTASVSIWCTISNVASVRLTMHSTSQFVDLPSMRKHSICMYERELEFLKYLNHQESI